MFDSPSFTVAQSIRFYTRFNEFRHTSRVLFFYLCSFFEKGRGFLFHGNRLQGQSHLRLEFFV